ncbi:polymeric immunoglobulin receptor [Microcaecilia unicolor]|uniref:polymeric immunoglobulin receptor n=1 Tax=Microcaecilia unicolor TaxID=1415580 RepID=UPI0011865CC0|nr:polymeric immunoglobulin receptor [Microcaecilia unicolor]
MTFWILVLSFLPAFSLAIFGPFTVTGELGNSVAITCHYRATAVNVHGRKFWCRRSQTYSRCDTITSTTPFIAPGYQNRASISDFPSNGTFTVKIEQLKREDTGQYRCGVGQNNDGFFFPVNLTILEDPSKAGQPELIFGEQRGSTSIRCDLQKNFTNKNVTYIKKFWCRMGSTGCYTVADSDGYVDTYHEGRIVIAEDRDLGIFKVLINQLKNEDSGWYRCGMETSDNRIIVKDINLFVSEDTALPRRPRYLQAVLGGSVSANCYQDLRGNFNLTYWCKWKDGGCTLLIDSSGYVNSEFAERISMTPHSQDVGVYTVSMKQLTEADAGWFWCGITDGVQEHTFSMKLHFLKAPSSLVSTLPTSATQTAPGSWRLSSSGDSGRHIGSLGHRPTSGTIAREKQWPARPSPLRSTTSPSRVIQRAGDSPVPSVGSTRLTRASSWPYYRSTGMVDPAGRHAASPHTNSRGRTQSPSLWESKDFITAKTQQEEAIPAERTLRSGPDLLSILIPVLVLALLLAAAVLLVMLRLRKQRAERPAESPGTEIAMEEAKSLREGSREAGAEGMEEQGTDVTPETRLSINYAARADFVLGSEVNGSGYEAVKMLTLPPVLLFRDRVTATDWFAKMASLQLFCIICLLPLLQGRESADVAGPKQVTGILNGVVTIQCFYSTVTKANKYDRKFLCKETAHQKRCETIISTNRYVSPNFANRATIQDSPDKGFFTVQLNELKHEDQGNFKCGIGLNNFGLYSSVYLSVAEDSTVPEEADLYFGQPKSSVLISCKFDREFASSRKYFCRINPNNCSAVIDSYGSVSEAYKGRTMLHHDPSPRAFSIRLIQLRKEDAGFYACGFGTYGAPGESKVIDLRISEETDTPNTQKVLMAAVGGSIAAECHYKPNVKYQKKYWCKWREHGCTELMNTDGFVKDAYEGRIMIHDSPENGTFTVIMNQLTKEDEGWYWCITSDETTDYTSTVQVKITEGQPGLNGSTTVIVPAGKPVKIPCHYPCKYNSNQKYWCKWENSGCTAVATSEDDQGGLSVNCDKERRVLTLSIDQVGPEDEGWYWCGVKQAGRYGETLAVLLKIGDEAVPQDETKPKNIPRNRAGDLNEQQQETPTSSHVEPQSQLVLSIVLPICAVILLAAAIFLFIRWKKNSDLVSVGSYRTNISLADLDNSQHAGKDNIGIESAQETEMSSTKDASRSRSSKKGSKEDLSYTSFLIHADRTPQ